MFLKNSTLLKWHLPLYLIVVWTNPLKAFAIARSNIVHLRPWWDIRDETMMKKISHNYQSNKEVLWFSYPKRLALHSRYTFLDELSLHLSESCYVFFKITLSLSDSPSSTCDLKTLVISQFLSEESGHDELWTHEEEDLLLNQSWLQHSTTNIFARKVHLFRTTWWR